MPGEGEGKTGEAVTGGCDVKLPDMSAVERERPPGLLGAGEDGTRYIQAEAGGGRTCALDVFW